MINVLIGIVRTKIFAVLLGPGGFGVFGIYRSILNLTLCFAGLGVNSSGVRQVAHASGLNDADHVTRTALVLRRTSVYLGVLGGLMLVVFSGPIARMTFGNALHVKALCVISLAVLFQLVSNGQEALLQGTGRVSDLAKIHLLGGLFGTVVSIPIVYFLRIRGLAPAIAAVALTSLCVSWWYSRAVHTGSASMNWSELRRETWGLLHLGVIFLTSYVMSMGTDYAVRLFLLRFTGIEATGYYQSAWTLGGLYVGFILQSMGADFYPRLTAASGDNAACNDLVNAQTRVGLLLAGPGALVTLTLAPAVLAILYSARFVAGAEVLRWISLGAVLQVVTWPMSYMIVAKDKRGLYFTTEFVLGAMSLGFAWIWIRWSGLKGAGMAFLLANLLYAVMLVPIVRRLSGFRWSRANVQAGILFFSLAGLVMLGFAWLPFAWATVVGAVASTAGAIYSVRSLGALVSAESIPEPLRRLFVAAHLAPRGETAATPLVPGGKDAG